MARSTGRQEVAAPGAQRSGGGARTTARRRSSGSASWVLMPLVFLLAGGAAFGYEWFTTPVANTLNGDTQSPVSQVGTIIKQVIQPDLPLKDSFNGRTEITVLMLGLDHVPSSRRDPEPLRRGDSELMAAVDFNTKQVRIVSIPRDGWVEELNSRGDVVHDKLAHAFAHGQELYKGEPDGGIRNAADAIQRLVGIQPDYYVVIQFDGLAKLVDALGGLDVDVEKRMKYTDRAGGLYIDFQPGPQHMTGAQVVEYARFRHDAVGDIGRMARQQKVIKLIMEEVKKPTNLGRVQVLADTLGEAVQTNFSPGQLFAFMQHIKDFDKDGVQSETLMSYGNQEQGHKGDAVGAPRGMSVQVIYPADIEVSKAFLRDLTVPPPPPPPGTEVANGKDATGKAVLGPDGKPIKADKTGKTAKDAKSPGGDKTGKPSDGKTVDGNGNVIGGDSGGDTGDTGDSASSDDRNNGSGGDDTSNGDAAAPDKR